MARKADRLSCIRFGPARYPVPARLIGLQVAVAESDGAAAGHRPGDRRGRRRARPGGPGRGVGTRRALRRPQARAPPGRSGEDRGGEGVLALGPAAEQFIAGSAASGNTRLAADLGELAALRAAHGDPALVAALDRAVAFRRWRAEDVRSILAAGTGTPQPRPAGDALVIQLPKVPVRPLSAYKIGGAS